VPDVWFVPERIKSIFLASLEIGSSTNILVDFYNHPELSKMDLKIIELAMG
jgi:hypothetical protein